MNNQWQWPGGCVAAISLTYDDGMPDAFKNVIPVLDSVGFKATFYLPTGWKHVREHVDQWRAAHLAGHEIANHTVNHPCYDKYWQSKDLDLKYYTPERIWNEVHDADKWLDENIGHDPDRTFGNPCGSILIGDPGRSEPYDKAIRARYSAGRTGGRDPNDPFTQDLYRIQCFTFLVETENTMIAYAERARAVRGWGVPAYHSLGGPNNNTSPEAHQVFIDYLARNRDVYWVAPVKEVVKYIIKRRAPLSS
jgi:peptidoglycan/xylan/chitin deacetylase (PgdA/CDA1 family)